MNRPYPLHIWALPLLAARGLARAPVDASGTDAVPATSTGSPTTGGLTGEIPLDAATSSTSTGLAAESSTGDGSCGPAASQRR